MHRSLRPSFIAVSLLTAACGDPPDKTDAAETSSGEPTSEPVQVCASQVFVGRVGPGQTCADHGAWAGVALGDVGLLAELCEYTWQGDQPADLGGLPGAAEGVFGLVESCPRVVPQADPFSADPTLRATIHNAFMTTVGKLSLAPLVPPEPPPWLTIVDTIPESVIAAGLEPNDRHGLDLRALAEGVLCDDPKHCPVSLTNTLGLPRITPDVVDRKRGGAFGSPMDLARGVSEAVNAWETDGDGARLVLALAVGWEPRGEYGPELAGKSLSELLATGGAAADVQAVLAALTRAACQDAWIVAAVGNATGEPCAQSGAVGPAMLQALASPTAAQCEAWGFPHAALTGASTPLLLSAGHIGFDGQPLANARVDAPAGITAQGATFGSLDGEGGLLTGSSVATIVGATTIAAVSAVYPGLSRADVLASVRPDAPTGVNVCRALVRACGRPGAESCVVTTCPEDDGSPVKSVAAVIAAALNPPPCSPGDPGCVPPNAIQLGDKFPDSQALGDNACGTPTTMWPSVPLPPPLPPLPWTEPQPMGTFCATCFSVLQPVPPKLTVGLSLPEAPSGPHPLLIEVQTSTGVERYALDPAKLVAGVNTVTILPALAWGDLQQVRLVRPVQGVDGRWYMKSEPLLRSVTACGNGVTDAGEDCDGEAGCAEDCTLTAGPQCGDGIVDKGEACDDGNMKAGDGCEADCTSTPGPLCGNSEVDAGEACDDGNVEAGDGCEKNCTLTPLAVCGNGKLDAGEACDDGNYETGDGCEKNCTVTPGPLCGNGKLDASEACDDGNNFNGDACSTDCQWICGNGVREGAELCDDGNQTADDYCSTACDFTEFCVDLLPDPCDADIDADDKNDTSAILQAIGVCGQVGSMSAMSFQFDSPDDGSWQIAGGFGVFDNQLGQTYSRREGENMLLLSTGKISTPKDGIVLETENSQLNNGDSLNPAMEDLPAPLSAANGFEGTPFQNCNGSGDCSGTLADQWKASKSYDRLFFSFSTKVPESIFGYHFDFALCTSEWSDKGVRENDLFVVWQSDPAPTDAYTGNVALVPDPAKPGHVLPLAAGMLEQFFTKQGPIGDSPQLKGTGFEGHVCTDWRTVQGYVQPGGVLTLAVLLTDMGDDSGATLAMLDRFHWGCQGVISQPQ